MKSDSRKAARLRARLHALLLLGGALLSLLGASRSFAGEGVSTATLAITRTDLLKVLRPAVRQMLADIESTTGLRVRFEPIPAGTFVVAQYNFDPRTNTPRIEIGPGWQDVDVAHELTHMRLELVERFPVLAWRRGAAPTPQREAALGRVRSYVDDEVVHARLVRAGYKADGEVLKPPVFDDVYTNVSRYLEEGRDRRNDGMSHLDSIGYGDLCRSAFLAQAELILRNYGDVLPPNRVELVKRFVRAFRKHRPAEAQRADKVLALFRKHDVQSVAGHRAILEGWARLEGLDRFSGITSYRRRNARYVLPWPRRVEVEVDKEGGAE